MSESEQNKTEEPTQFKLKKAREKGNVARGTDLGFMGSLAALSLFLLILGATSILQLTNMMRSVFLTGIAGGTDTSRLPEIIASAAWQAFMPVVILGMTVMLTIILFEVVQLRGLLFSAHPLKPDFNRLNPGKGLKRIFSMKTLKDAAKNIFKMTVYTVSTFLLIRWCLLTYQNAMSDANQVIRAMSASGYRLLFLYLFLALIFAIIDQVIVRNEYRKQMRMSKSELKRETKDREGEPRQKQKRKQLHQEFAKQTKGLGQLEGSDLVIVNPEHFAVALKYDPETMDAPSVLTKGRNQVALHIKRQAFFFGIPVVEAPKLARGIFHSYDIDSEIGEAHYKEVADIYLNRNILRPQG